MPCRQNRAERRGSSSCLFLPTRTTPGTERISTGWTRGRTVQSKFSRQIPREDTRYRTHNHRTVRRRKGGLAFFAPMFLQIENDKSLLVPEIWVRLFVPVGTLHGRKRSVRDAMMAKHFVREKLLDSWMDLPRPDI